MKFILIILICFLYYCAEVFTAPSSPDGRRTEVKTCTYRPFVRCTDPLKKQNVNTSVKEVRKRSIGETKICTLGPKYWCENIRQAEECDKLNYCTEKDWIV